MGQIPNSIQKRLEMETSFENLVQILECHYWSTSTHEILMDLKLDIKDMEKCSNGFLEIYWLCRFHLRSTILSKSTKFCVSRWKKKNEKKNAQGDSFLPSIKGHSTILLNCFYFSVNYSVDSYGCVLYVAAPLFLFCFSSQHVKSFWIIRRCASSSSDADNSQIAFGVKMT